MIKKFVIKCWIIARVQFNFEEGNGVINVVQNNYGARNQKVKAAEGISEKDNKIEIFISIQKGIKH